MNKNERINQIEVAATLRTALELLTNTKEQLDGTQSQLNGIQQQLNNANLELIRHTHNIEVVIGNIENLIDTLIKGSADI